MALSEVVVRIAVVTIRGYLGVARAAAVTPAAARVPVAV